MKRRDFIKFSGAGISTGIVAGGLGFLSWVPRSYAATVNQTFTITDGFIAMPDGVEVYFKSYSENAGQLNVPGSPIIAQAGDTVNITITNSLNTPHSFVINGVIDSGPIQPGQTANVSFTAGNAGSYLYYDNLNAPYNRLVGLHGGYAVMPNGSSNELYSGSPTFVQQYVWVTNDIDPVWHNDIRFGRTPGSTFTPYYFTLNGRTMRVPGHADYGNPDIDSGYNPLTRLEGSIGDRTLVRILNAGKCMHSVHFHANHVEWLARNGEARADIWEKDSLFLANNMGSLDVIFPFDPPPDAWPPVTKGYFPMHFHDEMTQTAGGGLYQFGLATTIAFK